MQGLALWLKNKWAPLIIMSFVFGGLHAFNPEIQKLGYIALVFYIGTGFFFGITTLLDEGSELAIGMHAINIFLGFGCKVLCYDIKPDQEAAKRKNFAYVTMDELLHNSDFGKHEKSGSK